MSTHPDQAVARHATDSPRRVPVSTYRLQFHQGFGFREALSVVPYLWRLGITDCYASPYFAARPGSTHGYDIVDHNTINPELGSQADYEAFAGELAGRGMGHILDFVPNHMGIDTTNPWWRDVLENGSCSASARFFDIDWNPVKTQLREKVLLPILGDQYGRVLERGELRLGFQDGQLVLHHFDHALPINPRQAPRVYRHGLEALRAELPEDDPHLREFLSILASLHNMPAYTERDPERIAERQREKEVARERLARLVRQSPRIRRHIEEAIEIFNGRPGSPESFDLLHDLLENQAYRLAYWRTALHEINYRRFFDINDLAGLRVEDPEVFEATHRLVARLLREGGITGIRVDHPDGLYDPVSYFQMLQDLARHSWTRPEAERPGGKPLYLLAEKILSPGESLPLHWPVHGTTGYDFLNDLNGLFVSPRQARSLRQVYGRFTGRREAFHQVVYESKKLIMDTALASELNVLADALDRLSEKNRHSRDFTLNSLRDVLTEVVASFPVYRTYISPTGWTETDRATIEIAIARARRRNPAMESSIFDFLREVLLPRPVESALPPGTERRSGYPAADEEDYANRLGFAIRFQQYTAPVQAKGLEDTAFYRYNLLISLNEVGGDPSAFGRTAEQFHEVNRLRLERWPYDMLATATHDTKLGEDVRARLNLLSELADDWRRELGRWARINAGHRSPVDGEPAPDRNDEYRFYQALVGVWPAEFTDAPIPAAAPVELVERMRSYMTKAIKEAKTHTSWITENVAYDNAVAMFVERVLTGTTAPRFLAALVPFARRIARLGVVNSLVQVVLKVACPGVPDFYRGTELWDLNLVDPDNRRPVDFESRALMLERLEPLLGRVAGDGTADESPDADVARLLSSWPDGRIKLFVTAAALRLRRSEPSVFLRGSYQPLEPELMADAEVLSFARELGDQKVLVVVPRLFSRLVTTEHPWPTGVDRWQDSRVRLPASLAGRTYRNVLTGELLRPEDGPAKGWLPVGKALGSLPVGLFQAVPAPGTTVARSAGK